MLNNCLLLQRINENVNMFCAEMTVDLSSPESETGSTDSGMGGEYEGECEMSQVRGVRRGPSPDRQRCNKYVRALVHRDSIPGLNSPYKLICQAPRPIGALLWCVIFGKGFATPMPSITLLPDGDLIPSIRSRLASIQTACLWLGLDVFVVYTNLTKNFIMLSAPLLLLPLSAFTFETLLDLTSIDFAGFALKLKRGKFRMSFFTPSVTCSPEWGCPPWGSGSGGSGSAAPRASTPTPGSSQFPVSVSLSLFQ